MLWRYLARPVLFRLDAETAHHGSMSLFHRTMFPPFSNLARGLYRVSDPRLRTEVFGLSFDNPVGLAAGFDKQARWFNALSHLGFSHIEVGTITGEAQPGNDQPRLFRLPQDKAIINRMGFNNVGSHQAANSLQKSKIKALIGINIGKTKAVAVEDAVADYLKSFRLLFPYARYFTVNVSSPNTPGLRKLQDRGPLTELLSELLRLNDELAQQQQVNRRPILLKIAPDLNDDQLNDIADLAKQLAIDGVIATNTTIARDGLNSADSLVQQVGAGGLSGQPLTHVSRNVVNKLYQQMEQTKPIVGVGGIMNGEDAWQMICQGASLIQTYTGFIYGGPSFVKKLNKTLIQKLTENGMENISDAVGSGVN